MSSRCRWVDLLTLGVRALEVRRARLKLGAVLLVPETEACAKVMHTDISVMKCKRAISVSPILVVTDFVKQIPVRKSRKRKLYQKKIDDKSLENNLRASKKLAVACLNVVPKRRGLWEDENVRAVSLTQDVGIVQIG